MIEGDSIKFVAYTKEELRNKLSKVSKPFTLNNNKIILKDSIVSNYNLNTNIYDQLDPKDKFTASKIIIDYYIDKNIYSRTDKLCEQKKDFNQVLSKEYKSKTKRLKQEEQLEKKSNIIQFNEKIIYKDTKTKDLLNDVYNNVLNNDFISLIENSSNLSNNINSINIDLKENVISNFLIYINDFKKGHKKRMNKSFDDEYLERFLFIDYDNTSSINKCNGYKK